MSGPVQDRLCLVLRIPPKLSADTVCKSSAVSEVCPEETIKFRLSDWSLFFRATLMLMPLLDHHSAQKQGGKKDAVRPVGFGGFKVVLTLLIKAVAVQVRIPIIQVGESSLY